MGYGAEDVEDQLSRRRRRIEILLQRHHADSAVLQLVYGLDQLAQRSAEPVQAHHTPGVAFAGIVEQRGKTGAFKLPAADHVLKNANRADDLQAPSLTGEILITG